MLLFCVCLCMIVCMCVFLKVSMWMNESQLEAARLQVSKECCFNSVFSIKLQSIGRKAIWLTKRDP